MTELRSKFPDATTFSSVFGQAVWLMTVSKAHRDLRISEIEDRVTPAIVLQQFKIYMKDKQPIAFLAWASVSDETKARFEGGNRTLAPHEWRSGKNVIIVECVSPFADPAEIEAQFLDGIKASGGSS